MKHALIALLALPVFAFAANNDLAGPKWDSRYSPGSINLRSIENADGSNTPAVFIEGSPAYLANSTVTRGNNTTTYTAGDVVGGVLTISGAGPSAGGWILITEASLMQNITAIPSGQTSFRLYLYSSSPASAIADNSPFTMASGDRSAFMGYIDIGSPSALGVGTLTPYVFVSGLNLQRRVLSGGTLYGYLVTNGALVPAAANETYLIQLRSLGL